MKIKKEQEEARKIAKEQKALANRPWYEKALDDGGMLLNELTGVNDAKRAATGFDPVTGKHFTAGERVAAGGMAAAGYIPIVGWAGRIFKGGKAIYKTTQATSAAIRAIDIYKTSQKSFGVLKTSQRGLYGLTAANGFSEAITGRDMFGNKISKEQQEASMNATLGMLLPFGAKGFHGKMGVKGKGNAVPYKQGGGSNPDDFVNIHSRKHMYDPSRPSIPNRSQYGENVDVDKLRQVTISNPDKAYSNWPNPNNPNTQRITKYYKDFDGNISTPETPTGSHRVFENIDNPDRSSHFPYVSR